MTRPIFEPSTSRTEARLGFGNNQLFRRPGQPNNGTAIYEIKVFEDDVAVAVGDDAFVWEIPEDLDGAAIVKVEAYISTAGGAGTTVQIRKSDPCDVGTDILSVPITIDTGECNSKDAAVQPVVIPATIAAWGDHLHIDVDADGSGAMGLGVIVALAPAAIASVVLAGAQGAPGAPGGITSWTGQWQTATAYTEDQAVSNNGSSYAARVDHTSGTDDDEPGVGANWETYWMLLAEGTAGSGPTWTYTLAASDTSPALQASADAVCTGTADQVDINTAINAAVGVSARVLLLPGTYVIDGAIDFSPLAVASAAEDGFWVDFDATSATIIAGANLTMMLNLAAPAGEQIFSKLNLRVGRVDGAKGTWVTDAGIYMQRFNDNKIWMGEVVNCTTGFYVDQAGVTDYGCFNNIIEVNKLNINGAGGGGAGFYASSDPTGTSIYGFQGNTVTVGQINGCENGVIIGDAANENAKINTFILGAVEQNTGWGIMDRSGWNLWLVSNTNSNGIYDIHAASGITQRSTFIVACVDGTVSQEALDGHRVIQRGDVQVDHGLTTSLPATPGYGDTCTLTDSLSAGTYHWQLRYAPDRATDKWICIGGAPVRFNADPNGVINGQTQVAATGYYRPTTGGVFSSPVAGTWDIRGSISVDPNGSGAQGCAVNGFAGGTLNTGGIASLVTTNGTFFGSSTSTSRTASVAAATNLGVAILSTNDGTVKMRYVSVEIMPFALGG